MAKQPTKRFCSERCKWTWTNRHRVLKPNVRSICKVCGKAFARYVAPYHIRRGASTNEYCSRTCKGKSLSGARHPMWKGGRILEADGYVLIHRPEHPHAKSGGYVFEHRLVMEAHLGRILDPKEVVHHENEIRNDNGIENLKLYPSNAEHKRDDYAHREIDSKGRFLPKKETTHAAQG